MIYQSNRDGTVTVFRDDNDQAGVRLDESDLRSLLAAVTEEKQRETA